VTTHRPRTHDYIIVGAGISGPFIAHELCRAGADCLMIEAGRQYRRHTYPRNDLDGTAQLYWSGGLELGTDARLVFLRPKVVGGGSVVNQALVDRFDEDAFDSWRRDSGVDFSMVKPWHPGMKKPRRKLPSRPSPPNTATATRTFSSRASSAWDTSWPPFGGRRRTVTTKRETAVSNASTAAASAASRAPRKRF
jgi:choline dehydrogenase-like flavoprotein